MHSDPSFHSGWHNGKKTGWQIQNRMTSSRLLVKICGNLCNLQWTFNTTKIQNLKPKVKFFGIFFSRKFNREVDFLKHKEDWPKLRRRLHLPPFTHPRSYSVLSTQWVSSRPHPCKEISIFIIYNIIIYINITSFSLLLHPQILTEYWVLSNFALYFQ